MKLPNIGYNTLALSYQAIPFCMNVLAMFPAYARLQKP